MDLGLNNKVAIVAASSAGLAFATAQQLAAEGAKVMLCSRSEQRAQEAIERIKHNVSQDSDIDYRVCDVTSQPQIQQLVDETVKRFGGIDILITNAAGPKSGSFESTELSAWEQAFKLTLMSATYLIDAALPHLRHSDAASILTITSVSTKQPVSGLLLSNVFRPAVIGMTKTLSQELGKDNIRVNSILPGWTATDRTNELFEARAQRNDSSVADEVQQIIQGIPLGRMGEPAEFGRVATFMVSPAASFINGAMLQVDGGNYSGLL